MNFLRNIPCKTLVYIVLFLFYYLPVSFATGKHPVLIISSYNPDSRQTSTNISDFMEEFNHLGGTNTIALENMNCKSFSEAFRWKRRLKSLLNKYKCKESPALIVLIGQEAWASYLSLGDSVWSDVPVLSALASRNAILLPDDTIRNLKTWMPESVDFFKDFPKKPIKSGFVFDFDVPANINLIKKLYPKTKNIAFISDNTYGGVSIQAHFVEEMKKFPDLNVILLDGRVNTIYTISDRLHELPDETVLLIGTWRVDMHDGYFMRNATYAMMEAVPHLPVFSLTSVGLGYWAIGGVVPEYRLLGKEMAAQAVRLLKNPSDPKIRMEIMANETVLDHNILKNRKIELPKSLDMVTFLNVSPSFYELYKYQIWFLGAILFALLVGLFVALFFFYRTKKLKDDLLISEGSLREAMESAQEASRLKTAFLANMSHEIRTPLNAIVGFSDVLSAGGGTMEEQRAYFDIIKTNSDLLLRLINDVLDVSRLEADRITFELERCDIVQLCRQMMTSVSHGRKSGNKFVFECEYETLYLQVDMQRIQQVIVNLLSNADKFTKNGIITLKIEVDEEKSLVLFSVSDTGCGIPLDKQELVFDRFEKLNEYVQGTGLGLSICRLIVKKWGGNIWVDSAYLGGSRFVFTYPMNLI